MSTKLADQTKETVLADSSRKISSLQAKLEDLSQENELLLLQLMQAQEELIEYFEQKNHFEELYQGIQARWQRLEKRLPNYVDFGAIEFLKFDNVSDVPSLTWRIKDYAQAGVAIKELEFETILLDGHPGIGLVVDYKDVNHFVPALLANTPEQLKNFLSYSASQFRQIHAIVNIFEQLEDSNWQGIEFPVNFDFTFWRPFLKNLITQIKKLPNALRYDQVRLKRELINPDYEHLWIEFRGLEHAGQSWPKFEVRLAAALVQREGFSLFPKFEFPLIDGKTKPFESWYAESYDDIGPKVELKVCLR